MATYIVRRILWGIVLIILVSALTFLFFYILPAADPAVLRAGRNAGPAAIAISASLAAMASRAAWFRSIGRLLK